MGVEGEGFYISQFKTFLITSVRLSLVTQECFDFRMAFDFSSERMGVKHNSAQNLF